MSTEEKERLERLDARLAKVEAVIERWEATVARVVASPQAGKVLAMLGVRL